MRATLLSTVLVLVTPVAAHADDRPRSEGARAADPAPDWDARHVRFEVPAKVLTDQVFLAKITMRNTGTAAWEGQTQPILYAQDPPGNRNWGTDFVYMRQGQRAGPGEEFTFVSHFRAPSAPGEHAFAWRLGRKGKDGRIVYFGQATEAQRVVVVVRPAAPPATRPARPAAGKKVLSVEDFEYVGSFKVPPLVGGGGAGFSESGLALRKTDDGTRRLFLNYTHPRQALFEVAIPKFTRLEGDPRALGEAEVKHVWGSLRVPLPKAGGIESIAPNGGLWWDQARRTLYWTYYHGYGTGEAPPVLAASKLGDEGTIAHLGSWRVPQPAARHYKAFWGGVTRLPRAFADRHTGGRTLALGFGGYYSICAPCSRGPALAAVAEPDPDRPEVDMVELMAYAGASAASRDGDYFYGQGPGGIWHEVPGGPQAGRWTMDDVCRAGVFVDLPDRHGYIAFVRLGTGRIGYDYGAIVSAGHAPWWYLYDPDDLGRAASGALKPGEVEPHSRTKVAYPAAAANGAQGSDGGAVTGACFDAEERLLYLYKPGVIPVGRERHGCVHVYRVLPGGKTTPGGRV